MNSPQFTISEVISATRGKLLTRNTSGLCCGVSTDSRTIKKGNIFFALTGENFDGHNYIDQVVKKGACAVVVSKSVKKYSPKVAYIKVGDTTVALGNLAAQYRKKFSIPCIAITGSAGKTTTKDIIAQALSKDFSLLKNIGTHNNAIGVPETLFQLNRKHELVVVELGTNHFGEIAALARIAQPTIAVITNIGSAHLEFFKNIEGVKKEKSSLLRYLEGPRLVFVNRDDSMLRTMKPPQGVKVFSFGIEHPADFSAQNIAIANGKVSFVFNRKHKFILPTVGKFNVYNALAAIGCGLVLGVSIKNMQKQLATCEFPQKRLRVLQCGQCIIFDDTCNSNPLSLKGAIESLALHSRSGRRIVVMGDMLELGRQAVALHRQIGSLLVRHSIDMIITLGALAQEAAKEARKHAPRSTIVESFHSKDKVTDFLKNALQPGDSLLIKGSRRLKMEDITNALVAFLR